MLINTSGSAKDDEPGVTSGALSAQVRSQDPAEAAEHLASDLTLKCTMLKLDTAKKNHYLF